MSTIHVDYGLCEANGVCMGLAPDVFDLDDNDVLHLLQPNPAPDQQPAIEEAIRQCPRQAITQIP